MENEASLAAAARSAMNWCLPAYMQPAAVVVAADVVAAEAPTLTAKL